MTGAEKLLTVARRELGTKESPAGSNQVKYNTAYYGRETSGDSYPWCCVFLWWCFREAGLSGLFYGGGKTASSGALANWARKNGRFAEKNYQPGDLVFFQFSGTVIEHMGVVERVNTDGSLVTIEGNTGTLSDANGGEVQRRTRAARYAVGALRPEYEEEKMTQNDFDTMMNVWLQKRGELPPGDFSEEARAWAEKNGIVLGAGDGTYQYKSWCTREQMLVFLQRFLKTLKQ
ncbi:CHAP domain-containing protein [uncultured Oscillibacter sp.]|uniref:CHAP domain-containing protein n=1 Tax=uncultured Oscillibacter sp. TaxID=876091 RepID=UPI0026007EAD|nr:CHAP domain-containing protein [uncultured Oscillibacter sp.]